MSKKGEIYTIPLSMSKNEESKALIIALNSIMSRIEDRFDELEARRGTQYGTTAQWEKDFLKRL